MERSSLVREGSAALRGMNASGSRSGVVTSEWRHAHAVGHPYYAWYLRRICMVKIPSCPYAHMRSQCHPFDGNSLVAVRGTHQVRPTLENLRPTIRGRPGSQRDMGLIAGAP
jgi:hypothetical protein